MTDQEREHTERAGDHGFWCVVARRFGDFWDFIDKRQIDVHCMSWATFAGTAWIINWATHFVVNHPDKSGLEVAAIIGAVMLPWTPLQAAVINWYFKARA